MKEYAMPVRDDNRESYQTLGPTITRRSFLKMSAAGCMGLYASGFGVSQGQLASKENRNGILIPPLFCTAYVTPDAPGQGGQEAIVAKYPLALVPQDHRQHFKRWRDKVKRINNRILLLAYQMVIEETTVPGPGHDKLRGAKGSWVVYPGGAVPQVGPSHKRRRIYDPRTQEWQHSFLEGCAATLKSYPYNGLFLDQCTVFDRAHPDPLVRKEMLEALQKTLLELRNQYPSVLLVGNSREKWQGLNGEMNEGRLNALPSEMRRFAGHAYPRIQLFLRYLKSRKEIDDVKKEMDFVHSLGGLYGACFDNQHVLWFDVFDEVVERFKRIPETLI